MNQVSVKVHMVTQINVIALIDRNLIGKYNLAIETDEFGHRGYDKRDKEIIYDNVYMIHSGKCVFNLIQTPMSVK